MIISFVILGLVVLVALIFLLRNRLGNGDWANPAVLAALVIGGATFLSALANLATTSISASYQSEVEMKKLQSNMLLTILQTNEPGYVPGRNEAMRREKIVIAIRSGIVSDDDGSICLAFVKEGCPIKVLKVK